MALLVKLLQFLGLGAVGVAAVGALAAVGGYLWLSSESGGDFVRRRALAAVEESIAGRVETRSVKLSGLLTVEMEGVKIFDPGGSQKEPVVEIKRLFASLRLGQLARKRIVVEDLQVRAPRVDAARLPGGGTTLGRALAPRTPAAAAPPDAPAQPFDWTIEIEKASVEQAAFKLRPAPGAEPEWSVRDLALSLAGRHGPDASRAKLEITAIAAGEGPGELPLRVDLDAALEGGRARLGKLEVAAGGSGLRAEGDVDLLLHDGHLDVAPIRFESADLAKLFSGGAELGSVAGELHATVSEGTAHFKLDLKPARGTIRLSGTAGLKAPYAFDAILVTEGLDPSALAKAAPTGRVELELRARGHAAPEPEADVELDVRPSVVQGIPARGLVRARYTQGEARVGRLEARVPGAELKAKGRATAKAVDLEVDARVEDLAALVKAVEKGTGARIGAARGNLRFTGRVHGPLGSLRADAELVSHDLAVGRNVASALRGSVRLEGLPRRPAGTFDLRAAQVLVGDTRLSAVRVLAQADRATRRVNARVRAGVAGGQFHTSVDGTLARDGKSLALDEVGLGWPEAEFQSEREVEVSWRDGAQVKGLALAGPAGRIALDASRTARGRFDAQVDVRGLDLARLPAFLLPEGLGLGGRLDLDAHARGTSARPELDARFVVAGATFRELRAIVAEGRARIADQHVTASGSVEVGGSGKLQFEAAMPIDPRSSPPRETLSARVTADAVDVATVARFVRPELLDHGLAGRVSFQLTLAGTAGSPELRAAVQASELRWEKVTGGVARLDLRAAEGRAQLAATASVEGAATLTLNASAPLDGTRALGDPAREMDRLLEARLAVNVEEAAADLAKLAELGFAPRDLGGRVTLTAALTGTRHAPELTAHVKLDRAAYRPLALTDAGADLALEAGARGLGATGTFSVPGAERIALKQARLEMTPRELIEERADPLTRPLVVSLAAEDADLERLLETLRGPPPAGEARSRIGGRADLTFELAGSAEAPEASARAALRDLSADGARIGDGSVALTHHTGRTEAEAELRGASGGGLSFNGEHVAALSARGLDAKKLLDAEAGFSLRANGFDLRVVQPFTPTLKRLAGKLFAELRARGPLRGLTPQGTARVEAFGFRNATYGELRDFTVAAQMEGKRFKLSRLEGELNRGHLEGSGEVDCGPGAAGGAPDEKGCTFVVDLSAGEVRVQQAGITRAIASAQVKTIGTFDWPRLDATVQIDTSKIEMPELPTKRVQSLDPHPDVVVLGAPAAVEEPSRLQMTMVLRLTTPLQIRARDISLDLAADRLQLVRAAGETRMFGEMRARPGGRVQAYGRDFAVERAVVTLNGDPGNPLLDVRARFVNPQAKAFITVAGTADEPKIDLSSEPPMAPERIMLFLATGRLQGRATSQGAVADMSQPAFSVVGSVVAATLRDTLKLPMDLAVEGSETIEGAAQGLAKGVSLKAGRYLGPWYLGGRVDPLAKQNVFEGFVEFQATPNLSIEATVSPDRSSTDVIFSIEK